MSPACALLAMAAPTLHESRPFRFMDLPAEIRYMIYELLMDRRVPFSFYDLTLARALAERATNITNCHHPAVMCVNKQVREEYTTIVMPHLVLCFHWLLNVDGRAIVRCGLRFPFLPMRIFSQLKILNLTLYRNAPYLEPGVAVVVPLLRAITSGMHQLSLFHLKTEAPIYDHTWRVGYTFPTDLHSHGQWKQQMTTTLAALLKGPKSLTVKAEFIITCDLYSSHPTAAKGTVYDDTVNKMPLATFAICNGPDRDTFELEGLDVKFLGVDKDLISGGSNTQVTLTSKNVLEG